MDVDPLVTQALDDLTLALPELPDLAGALHQVALSARRLIPGCTAASITVGRVRGTPYTIASSDATVVHLDQVQYDKDSGPCLSALDQGEVVWINDMETEVRWPAFVSAAAAEGMHMTLSVPLRLGAEVVGVLNLYSAEEFTEQSRDVATALADRTGGTVRAATLYFDSRSLSENLRTAMDSRAVIEQAKGIIMAQNGCTADDAFAILAQASMREGIKVAAIAQRIVTDITR